MSPYVVSALAQVTLYRGDLAAGHESVARMLGDGGDGGCAQEPQCINSGCGRLLQKPLQCAR